MIKIKPPTHTVDGLAVYVSLRDPAWDLPLLEVEREAQIARALKDGHIAADLPPADRARAIALAPVERYYAGKTRFQLDAADWGAHGAPITARDFLKPGETPALFGLRRLGFRAYQALTEIADSRARLVEACRLGLRSITADGYKWNATGDAPAGDEQLEALHAADPALVPEIGAAVFVLSRPLDAEAETPR